MLAGPEDADRAVIEAKKAQKLWMATSVDDRRDSLLTLSDLAAKNAESLAARVSRSASYWHPSHPLQAHWMYDREQGGGYLAGMLVHYLDFLCSLLGRPVSVCAEVRTSDPVRELPDGGILQVTADDTAALLMRMESGFTTVMSVSVMGAHAATTTASSCSAPTAPSSVTVTCVPRHTVSGRQPTRG